MRVSWRVWRVPYLSPRLVEKVGPGLAQAVRESVSDPSLGEVARGVWQWAAWQKLVGTFLRPRISRESRKDKKQNGNILEVGCPEGEPPTSFRSPLPPPGLRRGSRKKISKTTYSGP